jgi:uncharacterized protein
MISIEHAQSLYPNDSSSAHGFDHVLRVTALAERIARAEGADLEIVRTAALLHDIAADGPHRANHHIVGGYRAREILLALGNPPERVQAVAHCIQSHRFRKPEHAPQTLEAQCVFDADKLDAIGAVGIARAFVFGCELKQPMWATVSPEYKTGVSTGEPHTTHHEFYHKLVRIRERIYTKTGRQLAQERHHFMVEFINRMVNEVAGEA